MDFTLRNIHISDHMSRETTAFTADIFIDGERAASVTNTGTGGCHDYHFSSPEHREKFRELVDRYVAESGCKFEPADRMIDDALRQHQYQEMVKYNALRGYPVSIVARKGGIKVGNQIIYSEEAVVGFRYEGDITAWMIENGYEAYEILTSR